MVQLISRRGQLSNCPEADVDGVTMSWRLFSPGTQIAWWPANKDSGITP